MYENYYHLSNDPFRLLPDSGICFPHRSGSRAWAYLRYALKRGEGIVVVTGPPGSGKTTLAQRLLGEANPAQVISVQLVANDLSPTDLLRKLAYALGLPVEGKDRAMLSLLIERHLVEVQYAQRRVLVVIDEAQTLSHQSLEAMRLLTDLQSQTRPVMQLVLFGQEELEGAMSAPGMEQFQHRVIASCRLQPMDLMETKAYLEYRLAAVNWRGDPSINGPAVMAIYRYSHGVPRHVNKICSRLMLHGSSEERHTLDEHDVMAVVRDLRSELLAPLTHDATSQDATINALSSVYELALVPNPAPQRQSAVQDSRVLDEWPTDEPENVSPANSRGHRHARRPLPYQDANGVSRHLFRGGRRPGPRLSHRLLRRLRLAGDHVRQLLGMLPGSRKSIHQVVRQLLITGATRLRGWADHGRQWIRDAWPKVRAMAARPVWGQPLGVVTGGAAAVLLVALIAMQVVTPVSEVATPTNAGAPAVAALDGEDFLATGVLADSSVYIWSARDGENRDVVGFTDLASYLLGDLFGDEATTIDDLRGVLGPGVALPTLRRTAGEVSVVSGGAELQPLVGVISDATANQLLNATGRFESSMNVWALDRHPDTVANGGIRIWRLHPTTGEASLQGVVSRDAREGAADDVASAGPDETTVAADTEIARESPGVEHRFDLAGDDGEPGGRDYTRDLPATAAGGVDSDRSAGPVSEFLIVQTEATVADAEQPPIGSPDVSVAEVQTVSTGKSDNVVEIDVAAVDGQASQPESLPVSTQPVSTQPVEVVEEPRVEVSELIMQANKAIDADRLLVPRDRSAYHYLQRALAIDAENAVAKRGLKRIGQRYAALAHKALKEESYDKADRYVDRGLRVVPSDSRLLTLRAEVGIARAEAEAVALAEAEMARLAAQPKPEPEPVPPPKKKPSSFQSLMRLVEGI